MTASSSVRVAVCGLGGIGRVHLADLRSLRGCTVVGAFDADAARSRRECARVGIPAYPSWEALLADPTVEAVVLATPGSAHRAGVLACLEMGKHVFVEKPLAETLADAEAIAYAAARSGRVVQVGFCERFNPSFIEAKYAIPDLGRVASVQSSRVAPLSLSDPGWGLGPLDTAVHNFDLILWLTGARPVSVSAYAARLYPDIPGPTAVTTVVRFAGGMTAVDHVAWVRDESHPLSACARARMSLYGERGTFEVDLSSRPASLLTRHRFSQPDSVILGRPDYFGCLKLQLDAFLRAVETGSPSPVPALDGVRAETVAVAALESLATGAEVIIGEGSWPI